MHISTSCSYICTYLDAAAAAADPFLVVRLGILYDVLCYGCVYMEMCMCVAYLEANSCRNGSKKALYFNSFLNPCGTRIFRFPGARGERKTTFYRFHYHEVGSFLLSEYLTKIH